MKLCLGKLSKMYVTAVVHGSWRLRGERRAERGKLERGINENSFRQTTVVPQVHVMGQCTHLTAQRWTITHFVFTFSTGIRIVGSFNVWLHMIWPNIGSVPSIGDVMGKAFISVQYRRMEKRKPMLKLSLIWSRFSLSCSKAYRSMKTMSAIDGIDLPSWLAFSSTSWGQSSSPVASDCDIVGANFEQDLACRFCVSWYELLPSWDLAESRLVKELLE